RLSLLDHITRAIGERQDPASIAAVVTRCVEDSLPAHYCQIHMHDAQPPPPAGLARCLAGEFLYEPDVGAVPVAFARQLAGNGLRSLVAAPLRVENTVLGVLLAARREPHAFSSGDCEFLRQLSEHVALAARQAQLHAELRRAYDELRQSQQAILQQERL